jgi:hypothetical protein
MDSGKNGSISEVMMENDLWLCFSFFAACEYELKAHGLELKAERCEARNPAWARNLRRKASKLRAGAELYRDGRGGAYKSGI